MTPKNNLPVLIPQTKEEIETYKEKFERLKFLSQLKLKRDNPKDKILLAEERNIIDYLKVESLPVLKAKLSALQTAQELFIKIVDNMTAMDIVNNSEIGKSRLDAVKKYLKSQLLKDGGDASHPQTPNGRGSS